MRSTLETQGDSSATQTWQHWRFCVVLKFKTNSAPGIKTAFLPIQRMEKVIGTLLRLFLAIYVRHWQIWHPLLMHLGRSKLMEVYWELRFLWGLLGDAFPVGWYRFFLCVCVCVCVCVCECVVFGDRVSLCGPGCPLPPSIDLLASNSQRSNCLCLPWVLELKVLDPPPNLDCCVWYLCNVPLSCCP